MLTRHAQGDNTALHWAAMRGHVEIVNLLLQSGADKNQRNKQDLLPVRAGRCARLLSAPLTPQHAAGGHVQAGVEQLVALRAGGAHRGVKRRLVARGTRRESSSNAVAYTCGRVCTR